MSAMFENLKNLLLELDKFLQETLKKENVSKTCKEQKQNLVDKLNKLWEEYPQLAPSDRSPDKAKSDADKTDETTHTTGSSNTDEGEDPYADQSISEVPAQDLKDVTFSGFLEKKQRKGTFLAPAKFQKRWCVIKDGVFYYYESKKDKKQKGAFYMADYTFQNNPELTKEANKKELCFELVCPAKRTYQFMAFTAEDSEKWQNAVLKGSAAELIEEDIYEPIDAEESVQAVVQDVYDDGDIGNVYEPTSDMTPETPVKETPEEAIEEDVYDDTECEAPALPTKSVPSLPPSLPPSKANTRGKPPPPPTSAPPPPPPRTARGESQVDVVEPPLPKMKIVNPKEDFENLYYGKWDFTADTGDELTFKQGEMIHIISKEFDLKSWWIGELKGNFGLVPKAHLVPAYDLVAA